MASWAALRTFGNELRLADPYGPLVGDEIITVHSPQGAPRRSREGSFPISSFFGGGSGGRSFPLFGDNGELNAYHPGLAPDAFYMFGGEAEGDGDDGLFVKQDSEPEELGFEELYNTDIEVLPLAPGVTEAEKQHNSGVICGEGWSISVSTATPVTLPPAPVGTLEALEDPPTDPYVDIGDADAPVAAPGTGSVPYNSFALATPGVESKLGLRLRPEAFFEDGTWESRTLPPHSGGDAGNNYLLQLRITCTAGSITPRFEGSGEEDAEETEGAPITAADTATTNYVERRLIRKSAHNILVLLKDAAFAGTVSWASVRWVRKRGPIPPLTTVGRKRFLTLSDNVTKAWYKRTPDEITLERCGIGNVRSDDEDNMPKVQAALEDAVLWARDTSIPIKLGPKTYCVNGRPHNNSTGALSINVGDNFVVEGCGKQSVLKNCRTDAFCVVGISGGNNITLRNFTVDANCYEHPTIFTDENTGGGGILFYNRSTIMERLVMENIWVRRTDGYGVGCQNADIASFLIDGLFLEDCGTDGMDFKVQTSSPAGSNKIVRKLGILNNVHVRGFGRVVYDGANKTGLDLRGYMLATNIFIHDLHRTNAANVTGVRFNAAVPSDPAGRVGGRTSQIANVRVNCIDDLALQNIDGVDSGRCIGMEILSPDVEVVNFYCKNAHTGIRVAPAGPSPEVLQSIALSHIRVDEARGGDGRGAGIFWTGYDEPGPVVNPSGFAQIGPFHLTNCDRGMDIRGSYLRGFGFITRCSVGLFFANQAIADRTDLDVFCQDNFLDSDAPVAGVAYYHQRTIRLITKGYIAKDVLKANLSRLDELNGGELIIDGTHVFDTFDADAPLGKGFGFFGDPQIVINGRHDKPTFKIMKGPNLPVDGNPALILSANAYGKGKLIINNFEIDCSEAGNNTSGGATAGLQIKNWKSANLFEFGGPGGDGTTGTINYHLGALPFIVGQEIHGNASGAVGTVRSKTQSGTVPNLTGSLALTGIVGTFIDTEDLVGPVGGGLAVADGRVHGNLTGDTLLQTITLFDFLWQGGYARYWGDAALNPSGDGTRDGLPFDGQTANFVIGDLIVGGTSDASGVLIHQVDSGTTGTLYLSNIRGTFRDNEVLTGVVPVTAVSRGSAVVNGGLTGQSGDGFVQVMRDVVVERCTKGVAFKREGYSLRVDNCTFRFCNNGVTTAETTAPFIGSGRSLEVSNCNFFNTTLGQPLQAQGDTRVYFHDNLVRDWGRYAGSGTIAPAAIHPAVRIQGCRDFVIRNNVFEMINWIPDGNHTGLLVQQFNGATESPGTGVLRYTGQSGNFTNGSIIVGSTSFASGTITGQLDYDSTSGELYLKDAFAGPFTSGEVIQDAFGHAATVVGTLTGPIFDPFGGIARGNTYRNLDYGVRETSSGSNNYLDEYFDNVSEPTITADLNPGSALLYTSQTSNFHSDNGHAPLYEQIGPMRHIVSPGIFVNSALGSFTLKAGNRREEVRLTGNIGATDTILTLASDQAGNGAKFRIVRTGTGAGLWQIWDEGEPASPIKSLIVNTWCDVEHDGTAWRLMAYGAL